jgi:hypothetical protein
MDDQDQVVAICSIARIGRSYVDVRHMFSNAADGDRMQDQIIDAVMARSLHTDAAKTHVQLAWIVMQDLPDHPGKFIARLATEHPTIYVLEAATLAEIQDMLPLGLERSARQPGDPPEVIEIWFSVS